MYDALTGRFTFPCPARGEARVTLSSFRQLERLPGAAHPAVYHVLFACGRGDEHDGLVSHDDLDWAPLGLQGGVFYNLMTAQLDGVAVELLLLPGGQAEAGLPLVVLPAGAGRRLAWPRRPLPDVPPDVGEPRLARARRPSLPQRPAGRGGRARLQRRPRAYARGFSRRALFRLVRHPPPDPLSGGCFLAGAGYHPG